MKARGRDISRLLVSLATTCLLATPRSKACPRRCACYVPTEVHCTFRYLTSTPDSIPPSVERINLGYNSLARLTLADFRGLNKLELLLLHSNGIHTVPDKTFSDLQALQVLKMSYNKVRKIQKDTFYGLRSLTRLHMDHNSIEFISPGAFYGLPFLRLLHLEGNRLTKLHPDTFVSLKHLQIFKVSFLKYLYLSDNYLTSFPQEMLSSMPDLESLYLHGNPWTCDCHLKWLSDWIQEKPDVIKCKKDRSPRLQQCPLCMDPRVSKGKLLAAVPAAAFLCTKPTIELSLKPENLTVPDDRGSASPLPQDFTAPLGSLTLHMTDMSGHEANVVCNVQKPSRTLPTAFAEEKGHILLNMSFSTSLVCNMDYSHIQPVWQVLALYSDSPLTLERNHLLSKTPQLSYRYEQVAVRPEDTFTNIEVDVGADPAWLMQDRISLQLDRTATTLTKLQIWFSSDAQVTLPKAEVTLERLKWTMILRTNTTKLEHTVLTGGTIALDCPGQGDPSPHLEWLLADGSKVRAPYVSEDGRILIDKSGKLELQMADSFDTGTYHCVSTNYDDADLLTYRITVVEPSVESTGENEIRRMVVAGETLDLPCPSSGIPDASISWVLPGNIVLSQSSRDKHVLQDGTLRILQVTPRDQGHYYCIAANPSGVESLIFEVSVKLKGPRLVEHDGETDGSGGEEPNPHALSKESPSPKFSALASASAGTKAETPALSRSKKDHRVVSPRRRGDSANHQRVRENRRQFPPFARRIDPQHWAALLEKAKKNAASEKPDKKIKGPPPLAAPLLKIAGDGEDLSGMISPDEEFLVLETAVPSVLPRTLTADVTTMFHGLVTNRTSGTDVFPTVSPQRPQAKDLADFQQSDVISTTAMSGNTYPVTASTVESSTSQNSTPTFSLRPGVSGFQDAGQVGRRGEPSQRAYPVTEWTVVTDSDLKIPSSTTIKADAILESVSPTNGHQTPSIAVREARGSHLYSHNTAEPSTTRLPLDRHIAPFPSQMTRNNTTNFLRRKIWGRGRIISPYGSPVLRRHRYRMVRPVLSGAASRSVSASPATELHEICPSCPPTESPTSPTVALPVPGSSPNTILKATVAQPTALARYPSLLPENKESVSIAKATPTMTPSGAGSTRVIPTLAIVASAPASTANDIFANNNAPRAASTREAKGEMVRTPPLSDVLTKPSVPTKEASTWFADRKNPWYQVFSNNPNQKGILKNLNKSDLQKSIATVSPKISPVLPTEKVFLSYSTTFSENQMQILPSVHPNPTEIHSTGSLPAGKGSPSPSLPPLLPSLPIKGRRAESFPLVEMAPLATPTTPTSAGSHKTQTAATKVGQDQRTKEPQNHSDPNTTAGRSGDFTESPAVTAGVPPGSSALTALTAKTRRDFETLRGTVASARAVVSPSREGSTAARTALAPRPAPGPPLVPSRPSPAFTHSPVAGDLAVPSQVTADPVATAHPPPELVPRRTHFASSNLSHPNPVPSLRITRPPKPEAKPSPWSENPLQHQSFSERVEKGKKAVTSTLPSLSLPEATARDVQWEGRRNAKTGFDKKAVPDTPSGPLPSHAVPGNVFKKPRIVGGKAASFTIPANSDAFLPCEAAGNPLPSIHWARISSGIWSYFVTPKSRFQVLPNGTLSIQRVSIQDRGQYVCSASNPLGTDHLHVTLSVVSYPPRILDRQTKEITAHSGSSVKLKCKVEGRPRPTVSWILANQTVVSETPEEQAKALVTSDGTLVIRNLSIYDRGFYKCVARNAAGQDSLLVRLQVIAAPPVILEEKRQVIAGTQGDSLKLPCTVKGTPRPLVHWVLSDGTEVRTSQLTSSRLLLHSNGTLHIRNIVPSDRGTYECIATSSSGSERRVVILSVQERETLPRIEAASQKRTEVNLGDKLLLNCSASGDPKPRIIWRLPSKAVIDQWHRMGSRIHVYPNGSLFIGSVTEKDAGNYLCVARNNRGDDLTLMHVSLRLTPAKINPKHHFKKQVLHGKDFQVDCKASGSPVPEISWSLPDGTVINNAMQADDSGHRTKRYTLFHNGTLYFNKAGVAEEGDYTCYAQNTLGKDEMKVHLTVVTPTPRVSQGYKSNVRIKAGDTAVLDCDVTRDPKPKIYWMLPSRDMISFSKDRYMFHANGSLSIHRVKLLDSGDYVCVARNPSGDHTKRYNLDVISKPPLINGLYTNTTINATAVRHSRKHFDCRADGMPSPQIMWIMPGNIFLTAPYYGSRITVHKNGTLEIRNVRLSDSARFICVARNEGGESMLVVQLEVLEMLRRPTFRNPFNAKVVAQRGKPTTLNCSVDGNPPPEVIWILPNGTQFSNSPQDSQYLIASNGSLIIYKTTRSHAGKYRCAARNKVGYIEKLILLEIGQKPVILTSALGAVKGIGGESLALHCVTDGIPKPQVEWTTPSGHVIHSPRANGRYVLHENGTLVIKAAAAADGGNYVCEAHNSVGHALITVPVAIVAYPPRIVTGPPKSVLARTGVAFRLHCVALGVPKPEVTWEIPGHSSLSKMGKGRTHGSETLHPHGALVIQNPQASDSGLYRCLAKNPLGSDYAATYIQVL
uniref:Immunoglobulin superfamily member 10 n=1 Tax=Jaculus jaculus TaxID=51337 RepID=A0A8C5K616_JACJA